MRVKPAIVNAAARLGLVSRAEQSRRAADGRKIPGTLPARQASGDPQALGSVYRALFILETAVRQLSLDAWRAGAPLDIPPSIVLRPSLDKRRGAFIGETVRSLAARGNAYWKITRDGAGQAVDLRVLNPLEVAVSLDRATDRPSYSWRGVELAAGEEIEHLKLVHEAGTAYGYGPIQTCMATIRGALDMRAYADNWTAQSGRPTGILKTEQVLTQAQAAEWSAYADERLTPGGGIAVFGSGIDFKPIFLTPEELQFLQSQRENTLEIARMFGIPARLMLATIEGGAQTYANLEQEDISFLRYTLMAYVREIEEAFTEVTARGTSVRFNVEGLLRTDTKTRYEAHKIGLDANFLTVDEVRATEGLTPSKDV